MQADSCFDRFNHVLLPRATSLFHRRPFFSSADSVPFYDYAPRPEYTSTQMPFTREGGWGWGQEACVGAPGDATVLGVGGGGHRGVIGNGVGPGGNGASGAAPNNSIV
jgi:hypothetical protein